MVCGYTRPEIDAMWFSDYLELIAYLAKNPPTHALMKAYVGFKPRD